MLYFFLAYILARKNTTNLNTFLSFYFKVSTNLGFVASAPFCFLIIKYLLVNFFLFATGRIKNRQDTLSMNTNYSKTVF